MEPNKYVTDGKETGYVEQEKNKGKNKIKSMICINVIILIII
jgi:hypothetical protein